MAARITIQDIADELGVSRNTVSKAINNTGILSDSTREKVLKKAMEMGYKQFSYMTMANSKNQELNFSAKRSKTEIALFTTDFIGNSHFASTMIDKFQREISQLGYSLTIHRILSDDLNSLKLPNSFNIENTAGVICFEMFYHQYNQMLCDLNIPILFVDTSVSDFDNPLKADQLYMDNQTNIYAFIKEMKKRGKQHIGFVGEYLHCQSFFERYIAYRNALYLLNLPCSDEYCIIKNTERAKKNDSYEYQNYLMSCFQKLKKLPDVFLCVNDFIAIDVLHIFQKLGISVPEDVYLCGFDDSPESKIITPSLTTIHIHSQIMGVMAVQLLISRIEEPSLNFRTVYTETDLIYRKSTGD